MRRTRSPANPCACLGCTNPTHTVLLACTDPYSGRQFLKEFSPERASYAFARKLAREATLLPSWRDDPTYNLRKKS